MENQLYLYDCERRVDIHIPDAETVIGRDSILQCDDKRISRQHGIIKVNCEQTSSVQITSTHSNPIFIRTADNVLNILTKDLTATLRQGEKFALLPDQYWYEIRFRSLENLDEQQEAAVSSSSVTAGTLRVRTMDEVNSVALINGESNEVLDQVAESIEKRKMTDDSEAESRKKVRTEQPSGSDGCQSENVCPASFSIENVPPVVKPDPDASEAEAGTSRPKSPQTSTVKVEIKKETADSTGSPPRPSCEFGIRCYRHNAEHRAQFAHPNDVDYRRPSFPPAPEDAPYCPFGASCYRRNPEHFREYQHPDSTSVTRVNQVPVNLYQPQQQQQQQQLPPRRPPPNDDQRLRRRRRDLARDIVIAAIANPRLFAGSDEDDDDDEDLFEYESDSDEYRPGRESNDDFEDDDEIETQEFYEAEE
ncbi:aprataxin and PNK-like factor isoform X2 [Malaya genurostris]|uniref:aprataxin and PNK-like factor isoform X2 n=1 Tax=Malaya genurostris TaxID=325434 RepID=UPI0026F3F3D3|nr:aprataxin and PNK-like factor isoform X2 [Malaya genurostris]